MCDMSPIQTPTISVLNETGDLFPEEIVFPWDTFNETIPVQPRRDSELYNVLRSVINNIVLPIVFSFGVFGNIFSLVIFCKKRLHRRLDHIERSANAGLIALAFSDFLFCLTGLPAVAFSRFASGAGTGPLLVTSYYYMTYRGALLNIFLFSSTWLIVLISLERYLAICWPFRARMLIKVKRTAFLHFSVFVVAILINIPLFLRDNVRQVSCFNGCMCYTRQPGLYYRYQGVVYTHRIVWSTVGTLVPLIALAFGNCCLVRELYRAKSSSVYDKEDRCASKRTTITLLAVVLLFFFLVCPSMILEFLQTNFDVGSGRSNVVEFRIAILLTNLTQAIKFSCNFLLYCAINKQFRRHISSSKCVKSGIDSPRSSQRYQLGEIHH